MKFNFDLKSLKEKANGVVLVVLLVIILLGLLIFATWYTVSEANATKESIASVKEEYNKNIQLIQDLRKLKSNSEFYVAQKVKYDEVVADNGSYDKVDYTIYIDNLTRKYNLVIDEMEVGEMQSSGNSMSARTHLSVTGKEQDVRTMAEEIVSKKTITRIDDFALVNTGDEEGNVQATMTIVNFTK